MGRPDTESTPPSIAVIAAIDAQYDDRPWHLPRDAEFLLELPERVALVDVHVNRWHERIA
jgi:hypothetical protein